MIFKIRYDPLEKVKYQQDILGDAPIDESSCVIQQNEGP
jgi:hypothetical protein